MDEQIKKARAAAVLSGELRSGKDGRPTMVLVPSGSERAMHVGLTWHNDGVESTCQCRGSRNGLCYHQIAAVLYGLRHAVVGVTRAKGNAKRLSRTGGYVYSVSPEGEGPVLWLVVKVKNKNWVEKEDMPGELIGDFSEVGI